jgi:tyrosinase
MVRVGGIDRGRIRGSFLISAFTNVDGKRQLLGTEAVLSRWHVEGCANCQTHLEAKATFGLHGLRAATVDKAEFQVEVEVRTRDGLLGQPAAQLAAAATAARTRPLFTVEVR